MSNDSPADSGGEGVSIASKQLHFKKDKALRPSRHNVLISQSCIEQGVPTQLQRAGGGSDGKFELKYLSALSMGLMMSILCFAFENHT